MGNSKKNKIKYLKLSYKMLYYNKIYKLDRWIKKNKIFIFALIRELKRKE